MMLTPFNKFSDDHEGSQGGDSVVGSDGSQDDIDRMEAADLRDQFEWALAQAAASPPFEAGHEGHLAIFTEKLAAVERDFGVAKETFSRETSELRAALDQATAKLGDAYDKERASQCELESLHAERLTLHRQAFLNEQRAAGHSAELERELKRADERLAQEAGLRRVAEEALMCSEERAATAEVALEAMKGQHARELQEAQQQQLVVLCDPPVAAEAGVHHSVAHVGPMQEARQAHATDDGELGAEGPGLDWEVIPRTRV